MNALKCALLLAGAATALAGCERTVSSELPRGAAAYDVIAAPVPATAPSVYVLRPGDRLNLSVFREKDFSAENVLVDTSGNATFPLLGSVHVAGMTQDQLAQMLRERLGARYLRDPRVDVAVATPALSTISVEGQVEQPGVYEVMPGSTLLTSMALARSTTDRAKLDEVLVFRTIDDKRMGARFDLAEIRAGRAADPAILPGDVIVVGYSQVRGVFQDILRASPLFNVFTQF